MIISFANQKGGVGKTTLLVLFANYLASKGERVLVVDADHQKSAFYLREEDLKQFPDQETPYEIIEQSLEDPIEVTRTLRELNQQGGYILVDTPGNLTEQGLLQVFSLSEYIIVPYQYERKSLDSTGTFVHVMAQLKEALKKAKREVPSLLFIPLRIKLGEGLKHEKEVWAQTDEALLNHGEVLPQIKEASCLKRVNTLILFKDQEKLTINTLDDLYSKICPTASSKHLI